MPLAIILTLVISVALYGLLAMIAASFPDRAALIESNAPIALLFAKSSGYSGTIVASMASVAMINGILVQIMMAAA